MGKLARVSMTLTQRRLKQMLDSGEPGTLSLHRRGLLDEQMVDLNGLSDEALGNALKTRLANFRTGAPTDAKTAAGGIIAAVSRGEWRILIGDDAKALDKIVRAHPERAYDDPTLVYDVFDARGSFQKSSKM